MADQATERFFDISCQPLCRACSCETRTLYVHLNSGARVRVLNVRELELTNDALIIKCGIKEPHALEFRRKDVYFASCEQSLPPMR